MRASFYALLVALTLVLLILPGQGHAQIDPSIEAQIRGWEANLNVMEAAADLPDLSTLNVDALRDRLAAMESAARAAEKTLEAGLKPQQSQLETLGPPPGEGEPPESPEVARQREEINRQIAEIKGAITQAKLTITRAEEFESILVDSVRKQTLSAVLQPYPFPLAPSTVGTAISEMIAHGRQMLAWPTQWWRGIAPDERDHTLYTRILLIAFFAFVLGLSIRHIALKRFGRHAVEEQPTYARRLAAAIAEGLGDGIVPALMLAGVLYRIHEPESLVRGQFNDLVSAICIGAIILILAWALARAALSPGSPEWQLEALPPENARFIYRIIVCLAIVFAVDTFIVHASDSLPKSNELFSFYVFVTNLVEGSLVLMLVRGRLWRLEGLEPDVDETDAAAEAPPLKPVVSRFWVIVRGIIALIALASIVAPLIGYAVLGSLLINELLDSAVVLSVLFLLRGLLRELIALTLRGSLAQRQLGLAHPTRQRLKFWLRALLDVLFVPLTAIAIMPVWGVPTRDIWDAVSHVLTGITVGNVTISIIDLLAGVMIFAVTVIVTRMAQRTLTERVLPQTGLDVGVRHSLSAGVGYLGFTLALLLGVAAIGLDLSNLAIIAGALSVGIGFGLQAIVSNFVSGLILLIERPIKAGDWIVVAGHEGFVKQIKVRATELETFQRASVIIPNSELLSASVVNWTHKNTLGRAEVQIGVAYGSDVDQVMKILQECLEAAPRVLKWPEPQVLFQGFGDSALEFEVRGFLSDILWVVQVQSDLRVAINRALAEHGIEIPFPQRDIHLRDIDRLTDAIEGRAKKTRKAAKRASKSEKPKQSSPGDPALGDGDGDG